MKSKCGEYFNHDEDAPGYDEDVLNETNPVRAGYRALLAWVGSQVEPAKTVIDLGCGTGNTILAFPAVTSVVAVDISKKMLAIARRKLKVRPGVAFVHQDLLTFCAGYKGAADFVTSTYALHHLTPDERQTLFGLVYGFLAPGGAFLCGDLMWENSDGKAEMLREHPGLAEDCEDEFYWDLEKDSGELRALGFVLETKRFSNLSWGIRARKPAS